MTTGKIELMAPAGDFESLQAALDNGADSVYFGVEQLNMRARASINFTLDHLQEISNRCKTKNVRTYLTLNTIIYDHDLSIIKTLLKKAKQANITAGDCNGSSRSCSGKGNKYGSTYFHTG